MSRSLLGKFYDQTKSVKCLVNPLPTQSAPAPVSNKSISKSYFQLPRLFRSSSPIRIRKSLDGFNVLHSNNPKQKAQNPHISRRQRLFALASPALRLGFDIHARIKNRIRRDRHLRSSQCNNANNSFSLSMPPLSVSHSKSFSTSSNANNNNHNNNSHSNINRKSYRLWILRTTVFSAALSLLAIVATLILDKSTDDPRNWQLAVAKTLPLRFLSRLWGMIHNITLPMWMREPIYLAWTNAFGCDLSEAKLPLKQHKNLNEFFTRELKPGLRPFDPKADIVSPADSLITVFGQVDQNGQLDHIKGMSYSLSEFLGFTPSVSNGSRLYYAVLYLAPGDYHRFHSSSEWEIEKRIHFAGQLFPVKPSIAAFIPSLFTRNERVVLSGKWSQGFYSYTAVGAYNVGSMKLVFDDVKTNRTEPKLQRGQAQPASEGSIRVYNKTIKATKGQEIGLFELGSTVVLVWELKDPNLNFTFNVQPNQKLKVGNTIGTITKA